MALCIPIAERILQVLDFYFMIMFKILPFVEIEFPGLKLSQETIFSSLLQYIFSIESFEMTLHIEI